jgi:hypothetical protein
MAKLIPGVAECFYSIWRPILVHSALDSGFKTEWPGSKKVYLLGVLSTKLTDGAANMAAPTVHYSGSGQNCRPRECALCNCILSEGGNHRVHIVAMATFWRTFHQDGKISPGWWSWGGSHPPPFTHLPSRTKVVVYAFSWADRYTPLIYTLHLCVLCGGIQGVVYLFVILYI